MRSWIRIRISNADLDPADQNQCGSGTLPTMVLLNEFDEKLVKPHCQWKWGIPLLKIIAELRTLLDVSTFSTCVCNLFTEPEDKKDDNLAANSTFFKYLSHGPRKYKCTVSRIVEVARGIPGPQRSTTYRSQVLPTVDSPNATPLTWSKGEGVVYHLIVLPY